MKQNNANEFEKKDYWRPPYLTEEELYNIQCEIDETGYPVL